MKTKFLVLLLAMIFILSSCNSGGTVQSDTDTTASVTENSTESDTTTVGSESTESTHSIDGEDSSAEETEGDTVSGETETDGETESEPESESKTETETETEDANCPGGHKDEDDNGLCDSCGADVVIVLDLYAINDLHGKLNPGDSQPGIAGLTAYLQSKMAADEAAILLSSGDMWQGTSESNLTKGMIINDWLGELDCVSMTLGNHEFDWGTGYIADNAANSDFPFLAINVYDRDTNTRVEYCEASVVIEIDGLEVGIIGAIGDCYSSISAEQAGDVYFKTGSELTALVRAESQRLRAEGVDYIIYSIHDGYGSSSGSVGNISDGQLRAYYDIALSRDGCVDIVFEGHSHQRYVLKDSYGVYHLQGGGDNAGISHAEININFANGNSSINTVENVLNSKYSTPTTHEIVDALLEKYKDTISVGDKVLGYNSAYRSYDFINDLVAEVYYKKGIELWGDDYNIVLGGGFIGARSPYALYKGDVRYSDLYALMPFDNDIVLGKISGYYLKTKFFESNNSKYHIYYEKYGSDVYKNIDNNATYYIIVDSYTSVYTANHITEVARLEGGIYARDLLAEYVAAGGLA